MKVDSHIQLPISIIKSFSKKKSFVEPNGKTNVADYINIMHYGEKIPSEVRATEYGSKYGYYTEEIENLLSKEFETPIGEIRKKSLLNFQKQKSQM